MPLDLLEMRAAYMELATCRPVGMGGVGPIPWTAIHEYARSEGVEDEDRFRALIRAMDHEILTGRHRQEEQRGKHPETRG